MRKIKSFFAYFTLTEKLLWCGSVVFISASFLIFDGKDYLKLFSSLLGVTSLIFCAKGNPFGQVLMILFSTVYGMISLSFAYYGEMVTYLGMTLPMAVVALCSWIKNPFKNKKSQVKVNKIKKKEVIFMFLLAAVVSVVLYFVLKAFNTANLITSTLSVTTSFIAAYLTFRRSPFFALAYAVNDIVLIVLWIMATVTDFSYFSVIICFVVFLINDTYSFINWRRMERQQKIESELDE